MSDNDIGSGCIAALEAEKFLAEEESSDETPAAANEAGQTKIEPAATEQNAQAAKETKPTGSAAAEYRQNPLL